MSDTKKIKEKATEGAKKVASGAKKGLTKAKEGAIALKDNVAEKMDQNGDGVVDVTDIIMLAVKTPGVHITRAKFLRKELKKTYPEEVIEKAIETTPAQAGVSSEDIDKIANAVIRYERTCVSGISAALGAPGGWAMAATIPADIAQYYGYTLRAIEKLMYLYGFPEVKTDEEGLYIDTETMNTIILCLGVMNGVANASNAIKAMAKALAKGVEKKLMNKALTKGVFYPFVKSVAKWFGIKMTKEVFSGFFKKAIPVVGGVIGGGLTYLAFRPCCMRLKKSLEDTMLSNPEHVSSKQEDEIVDSIINGRVIELEPDMITVEEEIEDSEETVSDEIVSAEEDREDD